MAFTVVPRCGVWSHALQRTCGAVGGDLRKIEMRVRWGAAVRRGSGTGFSGRPFWACERCRKTLRIGGKVWKYHKPNG